MDKQPKLENKQAIASPCVGICKLNEDNICIGCYRNIQEIAKWADLSEDEKLAVLEQIAKRKAKDE